VISIRGQSDHVSKNEQRYAIRWCTNKLISDSFVKQNRIILWNRDLSDDTSTIFGNLTIQDDGNILIDVMPTMSRAGLIKTIFHELTHLKQALSGKMEYGPDGDKIWKKQLFRNADSQPDYIYQNFPWEVEARKFEKTLYRQYRSHLEKNSLSFT
jgi:hypothetical protein